MYAMIGKDFIPINSLEEGMPYVWEKGAILLTDLERFLYEDIVWRTYFPLYLKRHCQFDEEN